MNELAIKPGTRVRDLDYGVNGEILEVIENSGWITCEILWERKMYNVNTHTSSYSTIEFIEDLEVVR